MKKFLVIVAALAACKGGDKSTAKQTGSAAAGSGSGSAAGSGDPWAKVPPDAAPETPEKRKEVLSVIKWFNEHSLAWAGGGHVPAFTPVTSSDDFKNLKPNSDYSGLATTAVFDPVSTLAGVASPVYDAAGNYIVPVIQGEMAPADGAQQLKDDLQGQVQ